MMNYLYFPISKGNTSYQHLHKCTSSHIKLNSYKDEFITTSHCSPRFRTKSVLQFNIDSNKANDNTFKRKSNVSFIKTTKLNFNKIKSGSLGNNNKNKYKAITERNKHNESGCSFYKKKRSYKSSSCNNNVNHSTVINEGNWSYTRNSKCVNKRNNLSSVVVANAQNWKYQHNRKDSLYSTKGNTTCDDSKNHYGKIQEIKVESVEDAHINFVKMIQETKNFLIHKEQGSCNDISLE